MGAFSRRIEAEIEQNLDALLAAHARPKSAAASHRTQPAGKAEAPRSPASRGAKAAAAESGRAAPRAPRSAAAKRTVGK